MKEANLTTMTVANMLIIIGSILIPLIGLGGMAFLFLLSRMDRVESDIRTMHNRVARLEGYIARAIGTDVTAPAEGPPISPTPPMSPIPN